MVKTLTCFLLLCTAGFCRFKHQPSITIMTDGAMIKDEVHFTVTNTLPDSIEYNVSLEYLQKSEWREVYSNIFEFDRDKIQTFVSGPKEKRNFSFQVATMHPANRKLLEGKKVRLGLNVFARRPFENLSKVYSLPFQITEN